jgi:hypothetical protein
LFLLQFLPDTTVAGDQEFRAIVDHVAACYQKRPMRFIGLLNFIANRFTPHGVSHFKMAIFEDLDPSHSPTDGQFDSFMQGLVGSYYERFVRVQNNHSGERTFIYARESGKKNFEMLIVSMEPTEVMVMKMRLKPEVMRDWVDEPVEKGRDSSHRDGAAVGK